MGKWWNVSWSGRVRPIKRGGRILPKGKGHFVILHPRRKIRVDFLFRRYLHVTSTHPRDAVGVECSKPCASWELPDMRKKSSKAAESEGNHLAPVETEYYRELLPLVEHCCCRKYDDGDPREVGWITIKTQGSAWVVQVKDPDSGCSFSAVGATLDKALETAALLLGCDEAPWEPDTWLMGRKRQKKTK